MDIIKSDIDGGKAFDWGRTSEDYAKFRDIYPPVFYEKILERGLCRDGQRVLDIGTGTGVIPRNLYRFGAEWTATDISENQILQAKRLAEEQGMNITFRTAATEELTYPGGSFDVITACQCFWYFDHKRVMPELQRMLTPGGKLVLLYMAWLPFEDTIAGKSEELVLKYNPGWTGAGEKRKPIWIPDVALETFDLFEHEEYDMKVPFTRESWHGRMKACRGVGASLNSEELERWEAEHWAYMKTVPEQFEILHYAAISVLERR